MMTTFSLAKTLSPENAEAMGRMVRAIDLAEGFTLFFARCDKPALRGQLLLIASQQMAALGIEVVDVVFTEEPKDVRRRLRSALKMVETTAKRVVFVTGLEIGIPRGQPSTRTLAELNLGRDQFPHDVPHPLVIWLPDEALTAVARFAPDFWAWRSGVFEFQTHSQDAPHPDSC